VPLPGEPVPSITVTSEWSATAGTIDVEVTTLNFTPATVRIHPHGVNAPALVDNTAPFEFSIDATSLALGDHQMLVVATDWSTYVVDLRHARSLWLQRQPTSVRRGLRQRPLRHYPHRHVERGGRMDRPQSESRRARAA
jgi:hypothetical protein